MKKMLGRTLAGAGVAALLTVSLGATANAAEAPATSPVLQQAGVPIYALPGGIDLGALLGPTVGVPQTALGPIFGLLP